MLHLLISLLLFVPLPSLDTDLKELSSTLDHKADFDIRYEQQLDSLRAVGNTKNLYQAFNSYCYDSALYYARQLVEQSEMQDNYDAIVSARIKLAYCYMSGGRFRECAEAFNLLDEQRISPRRKTSYYSLRGHLLYDIACYERTPFPPAMRTYYNEALTYIDPKDTVGTWNIMAQLARIDGQDSLAIHYFEKALAGSIGHTHSEAIFLSSIAQVCFDRGDSAQALHYWSRAAIRDLESSTKEIVAMQKVAQLLHKLEHNDMADRCIRSALDDAQHYHARHRQLEVSEIMPIIDTYQIEQLHLRAIRIRILYTCIVLLLLTGVLGLIRMLHKLHQRNNQLTETQNELEQSNRIKETYLTAMLAAEADHTEAIERYAKHVMHCVRDKNWENLLDTPSYISKMGQRTAFYRRFDTMFLHLYPHFIEEVNRLLTTPVESKEGALPSELRVFALMRLGVKDNEQMAHILSCSLATIHTYKARIYAQIKVPKQQFIHLICAGKPHETEISAGKPHETEISA